MGLPMVTVTDALTAEQRQAILLKELTRPPVVKLRSSRPYTHSTVIMLTGPKRSGKSLLMAKLLFADMLHARHVWSNMPVKTPDYLLKQGYPMLKTDPIDWDGLYMLDDKYQEGTIGLDESIYYDDSRSSLSMRNKLLNTIMNQVGHRNLNVYFTVKTGGWLDKRLLFETDLEIRCTDMAMTPYGRELHLVRGKNIGLAVYDRSGAYTGKIYNERMSEPDWVGVYTYGDIFWTAYDTREIVGLEDLFTGVKVDLKQRVISNKTKIHDQYRGLMFDLATKIKASQDTVGCDEFWFMASGVGVAGDARQLGALLPSLGIIRRRTRAGSVYDLTNLLVKAEG